MKFKRFCVARFRARKREFIHSLEMVNQFVEQCGAIETISEATMNLANR